MIDVIVFAFLIRSKVKTTYEKALLLVVCPAVIMLFSFPNTTPFHCNSSDYLQITLSALFAFILKVIAV